MDRQANLISIPRANEWLAKREKDEKVKALVSEPSVKGMIDQVRRDRDADCAKIAKFAEAMLVEAKKAKLDQSSRDKLETMCALDFLVAKGLLKADATDKIRPLGVPIGLAAAAIVILHLFIGGRLYVL